MAEKGEKYLEYVMLALAQHFARIFCFQKSGDPRSANAVLKNVEKITGYSVFRLACKVGEREEEIRFSIRSISGVGSKSMVFEFTYKYKLAVKIASEEMSLEEFKASVSGEFIFQEILRDEKEKVKVVTPSLQILGSILRPYPYAFSSAEDIERYYVKLFQQEAKLQNFLSCEVPIDENDFSVVGRRFLYTMPLADNLMLSDYYRMIHGENQELAERETVSIFPFILDRNYEAFINHFDKVIKNCDQRNEAEKVLDALSQAFRDFVEEVKDFSRKNGVSDYNHKAWFATRLVGLPIIDDHFSLEIINFFNAKLLELMEVKFKDDTKKYRDMLQQNNSEGKFIANRQKISAIITNLLLALVYLKRKGVASRDLKPYNYIICGANFDGLNDFLKFNLGFLDLETAISVDAVNEIGEPKRGGSPYYANPTFLFSTALLRQLYGDVARMFILQDWHATVVMIYQLITGEQLFGQAAKNLPKAEERILAASFTGKGLSELAIKELLGWLEKAIKEFEEKIKNNRLGQTDVRCPKEVIEMFLEELNEAHLFIEMEIEAFINKQTFLSENTKASLIIAREEKTRVGLANWLLKLGDNKTENHLAFAKRLIQLKKKAVDNRVEKAQIEQAQGEIKLKANRVLEFMNRIVLEAISAYRE